MEKVVVGGIYKHYKGHYYKVEQIAHHCGLSAPIVIYHKCNEMGVFKSIREYVQSPTGEIGEVIVKQPFYRDLEDFLSLTPEGEERFTLIKKLYH